MLLNHPTERFCTAIVIRMRHVREHWQVTMANGGHPPAVLLQHPEPPRTLGEPTCLVGAFDDAGYDDVGFDLVPGATVLLYTDGVTEARSSDGFYDDDRLSTVLRRGTKDAASLVAGVLEDVLRFQEGQPKDDIAMIALHVPPLAGTSEHRANTT